MAVRGGNVKVRFTADTSDVTRGALVVEKSLKKVETSGQRTLSQLKTASIAATGAIAGGLFLVGKSAIQSATDVNESLSKNQVLFGKYAKSVEDFSNRSARSFGISKQAALEYTGVFGNLFIALGESQKNSAKFSTQLTQLAADMASFNNTSIDDALEAIRSGLVGETEPLRRFGVNLQDATLRQEAMALGLTHTTKNVLTPYQRSMAAMSLITKQTEKAHGDFSRTSGQLANQQRILQAQFSDVEAELGRQLLPTALKVVSALNDFVKEMRTGTGAGGDFARTARKVADVLGDIGGFLKDHPKLIAAAVAAWGAYKTASLIALAAIKVQTFRKAFGLGKGAAAAEGAIAGRTYATSFDAGSAGGLGKLSRSGRAITALKSLGRAWGPILAAALWVEVANIIGDKTPELVQDTANQSQRGVVRGPRRGGRGGPTEPRNQSGPGNSNIPDFKAFTGSAGKRGIVNIAGGGGSRSLMAAGPGGPAVGTNAPGFSGGSGRRLSQPQIAQVWVQGGGRKDMADLMSAIAMGESGGNTAAHNTSGEDSRGLWQINVGPGANTDFAGWNLFDPVVNARAAKAILARQGLNAWTVYSSGVYRQYLGGSKGAGGQASPVSGGGGTGTSTGGSSAGSSAAAQRRAAARQRAAEDRAYETPGTAQNLEAARAQFELETAQGGGFGAGMRLDAARQARIRKIRKALRGKLRPATRARLRQELAGLIQEGDPSQIGRTLGPVTDAGAPFTQEDFLNAQLAQAGLTEGTGDDIAALTGLQGLRASEYSAAVASGDPRRIAETASALAQVNESLKSLKESIDQAAAIQAQRDAVNEEIRDNQRRLLQLADQGKLIEASVGAMVNGWIGERLGPKLGLPSAPGVVAAYGGRL